MTAKQFIELIQYGVQGIPTLDGLALHEDVIRLNIGRAYNQVICELVEKGYSELDLFCRLYSQTEVKQDFYTGMYYSEIPVDISPLPNVKSGVRSISPFESRISYIPLNREKIGIYSNLAVSTVSTRIGYTLGQNQSGQTIVEYFGMSDGNKPYFVSMYLLIPFEVYDDEDTIHIPAGKDEVILNLVIKMLGAMPPVDLKTSNSQIKQ